MKLPLDTPTHRVFKCLKAGLVDWDDLEVEQWIDLWSYYHKVIPDMFPPNFVQLMDDMFERSRKAKEKDIRKYMENR